MGLGSPISWTEPNLLTVKLILKAARVKAAILVLRYRCEFDCKQITLFSKGEAFTMPSEKKPAGRYKNSKHGLCEKLMICINEGVAYYIETLVTILLVSANFKNNYE